MRSVTDLTQDELDQIKAAIDRGEVVLVPEPWVPPGTAQEEKP